MKTDRRKFMACFAGSSVASTLFPGALWALIQQQQQLRVTMEMVKQAEQLAGLEFTESEREAMLRGLNSNLQTYELLRTVPLPNSVPPAIQFDPLVPGMRLPAVRRPVRFSSPGALTKPKNLEEVAFWPVLKLAALVRTRQVSPVALTEMYLDRLKRHDKTLLAVVSLTEERALAQARRAEAEIKAGRYKGHLHGIPWGAKDLLATKGYKTTWGASPYKDQTIDEDATVVQRLDRAGAILVAKLTLGALAQGDRWFGGMTRNPWRTESGSSGSSAGPGSATAAGLVGFSIGTETQGSIVSPSRVNGVTGLRPTFGRVPRTGAMALSWSMDKIGPMCRTVEDCAIVFNAIMGPDGQDLTIRDLPFNWDALRPLNTIRVGYLKPAFDQTENRQGKEYDDAALEAVRKLGIDLKPIDFTMTDLPVRALGIILSAESAAAFDDLTRSTRDDQMQQAPETSTWPNSFRQARMIPAVEYIQATRVRTLVMRRMAEIMKDVDVVVAPTNATIQLTNHTGHPCVVCPAGFTTDNNTPWSISFIGGLYKEAEALRVAKAYQDATGWHLKYPPGFVS